MFDNGARKQVTLPWREQPDGQGVSDTQYTIEVEPAPDLRVNTYDFTVRACNDDGCSAYTSTVTVKVAGAEPVEQEPQQQERQPQTQEQSGLPGPVVNLQLSAASDSVTVAWEAPETGDAPDRYIVHLKPADGSKGKVKKPRAKKTSVTFRKLEPGATYEVRVRAENADGKGDRSTASVTLPSDGGVQGGQGDPPPTPAPTPTPEPQDNRQEQAEEPTQEPEQEPQPTQQEPEEPQDNSPQGYDADGNGAIDFSELDAATSDWLAGKITDKEYQEIVKRLTG